LLEEIHDFHQLDAVLNRFALPEHQESVGSIGDPVTEHVTTLDDTFSHVMFGNVDNNNVLEIPVDQTTPDLLSLRPFVRSAWVEQASVGPNIFPEFDSLTLEPGTVTNVEKKNGAAVFVLQDDEDIAELLFSGTSLRVILPAILDATLEDQADWNVEDLNKDPIAITSITRTGNIVRLFSSLPIAAAVPDANTKDITFTSYKLSTNLQKLPISLDGLQFTGGTGYVLNTSYLPPMTSAKLVVELASPLHLQHGPSLRTTASNAQKLYQSFTVDLNAFAFFRTQKMAPLSILRAGGFTIALELARPEECLVVPFEIDGQSPAVDVRSLTMHVRDPQISIWASNYDSIVSSSLQEQLVQAGALQLATTKWTTGHGRLAPNESVITIAEPGVSVRGIMVVLLPNPRGNSTTGVNTPRYDPFVSTTGPFTSAHLQFMGRQWPSKSMPIIQPNLSLFGPGIGDANAFAYLQQTNGWEFADNLVGIAEQQGNKSFACNVDRMSWAVNHYDFRTGEYAGTGGNGYCANYGNFVYAFNLQSYATHGEARGVGWNLGQTLGSDVRVMLQRHPDASATPEVDYVYFVLSDAVAIYQADGTCKLAV